MWRLLEWINPIRIVRLFCAKRLVRMLFRFILPNVFMVGILLLFLYLDQFKLFEYMIVCPLHTVGLYCPACGMTRSAHALLRLDFKAMITYHPLMPLFILMILFYEVSIFLSAWKRRRILRHPARMAYFTLAIFLAYFIYRNVMLLVYKVDPIGDFIPLSGV